MSRPAVGDQIPPLTLPPISRHTLALYCAGSGDHNPIHVDADFAREEAGLDDVIAHGMLVMGFVGRHLAGHAGGPGYVKQIQVRFLAPIHVGDVITCCAEVTAIVDGDYDLDVAAVRQDGAVLVRGKATLRL